MPNNLGISRYLTSNSNQDLPSFVQEGSPVFTSAHIPEETGDLKKALKDLSEAVHERKASLICDVDHLTADQFGCPDIETFASEYGIDRLRLDDGFSMEEIEDLARRMPIALNASTIPEEDKEHLCLIGKDILFIHNFYPRPETGLDLETFASLSKGCRPDQLAAFIAGDETLRGPLFEGLPTLEAHRHLDPYVAWVHLNRLGLKQILVGDPGISQTALDRIHKADNGVFEIPCSLDDPSLYHQVMHIRPDSPKSLRRLSESRAYGKPAQTGIDPADTAMPRTRGSITRDNWRYGRYCGEVMLAAEDYPADEKVNVIGHVAPGYVDLLDWIPNGAAIELVPADES